MLQLQLVLVRIIIFQFYFFNNFLDCYFKYKKLIHIYSIKLNYFIYYTKSFIIHYIIYNKFIYIYIYIYIYLKSQNYRTNYKIHSLHPNLI